MPGSAVPGPGGFITRFPAHRLHLVTRFLLRNLREELEVPVRLAIEARTGWVRAARAMVIPSGWSFRSAEPGRPAGRRS